MQRIVDIFNGHGMLLAKDKSVILHDVQGKEAQRPVRLAPTMSNEQVRKVLHAKEPVAALRQQGAEMADKLRWVAQQDAEDIRGASAARDQLQYVLSTLAEGSGADQSATQAHADETESHQCQHCDRSVTCLTSLRKHIWQEVTKLRLKLH